eukprot:865730-Pyramimonas_sp.AAC.1
MRPQDPNGLGRSERPRGVPPKARAENIMNSVPKNFPRLIGKFGRAKRGQIFLSSYQSSG